MKNDFERLKGIIKKHNGFLNDAQGCINSRDKKAEINTEKANEIYGTGIFQISKRVKTVNSDVGYSRRKFSYEWVEQHGFYETPDKAQEMIDKCLALDPYNEGLTKSDFRIISSRYYP